MNEQEVSLVDVVRVINKRKIMIFVVTAFFTLVGIVYAVISRPDVDYTATGVIRIGQITGDKIEGISDVVLALEAPSRLMKIVENSELRDLPAGNSWQSKEWLENRFVVEAIETEAVEFRVTWPNPEDAKVLVNSIGEDLIAEYTPRFERHLAIKSESLRQQKKEIDQLTKTINEMETIQRSLEESSSISAPEIILLQANLESRLNLLSLRRNEYNKLKLQLNVEPYTFNTYFIESPLPYIEPHSTGRMIFIIAAFTFGLIISLIVVFVRESLQSAK